MYFQFLYKSIKFPVSVQSSQYHYQITPVSPCSPYNVTQYTHQAPQEAITSYMVHLVKLCPGLAEL